MNNSIAIDIIRSDCSESGKLDREEIPKEAEVCFY
jgi:hypothetical protein